MSTNSHLSTQAIEKLKRIYEDEFSQALSDDEADEIGLRLLRLFDILLSNAANSMSEAATCAAN